MKNDGKALKHKKNKYFLLKRKKNERNNNNNNITFGDINEYTENEEINNKMSINKTNHKNGLYLKKSVPIKLPLVKKFIHLNSNENETNISKSIKKSKTKLKINTNSSNNFNQKKNKQNKLLSKNSESSHNIKISPSQIKTKSIINSSSTNIGVTRQLNRKLLKGSKNKIKPKHVITKLLTTTKIINNFNNQINQNKNKEIINVYNDHDNNDKKAHHDIDNNNDGDKKIDIFYDIEKKVSKIQNIFRKHLKDEEHSDNNNKEITNKKNIELISEISLSEEELSFSEDDSFDNMEFSLEDEDI